MKFVFNWSSFCYQWQMLPPTIRPIKNVKFIYIWFHVVLLGLNYKNHIFRCLVDKNINFPSVVTCVNRSPWSKLRTWYEYKQYCPLWHWRLEACRCSSCPSVTHCQQKCCHTFRIRFPIERTEIPFFLLVLAVSNILA